MKRKHVLFLSLPLAALIIGCSLTGILTPGFYGRETPNWQAQSNGQDLVDLILIVPALLVTAIASRRNEKAFLLWGGVMLYVAYTFVLYCFEVHFNSLFFFYCLALGLSIYGCIYFALQKDKLIIPVSDRLRRSTGIYFLVIAAVFYMLWLSEVLPASFSGKVPASVEEAGLFTNGVQVLDLAIVLPGIFLSGILLLKKNEAGYFLAPAILSFFILMDLTIAALVVLMYRNGLTANPSVAIGMIVLSGFSSLLLASWLKIKS
jgi:hypothetical protein